MTRQQRADTIAQRLAELFPQPTIPLVHRDPFTLLVAVVLSAQCTDARVNQVTPELFRLAKTAPRMAQLKPAQVEKIIRPCGLAPQKSKALVALSKILVERFAGRVPSNFADLESLPGVGHKTASVVMSQAFNIPAFPVDTHIHRLATRWRLTSGKNVVQTEKDLKRLFPRDQWRNLHLQIIYYGRQYCTARGCDGATCEICAACNGQRRNQVARNRKQSPKALKH